uniref:PAM2 domain-containing protein n=1 Tax=Steinernema glaseri TaxID=37863 RepID=A0A1I8ARK0_9BILA
ANKAPSAEPPKALKLAAPLAVASSTPLAPKFSLCEGLSAASYMKSINEELVSSLYSTGTLPPAANPYVLDPFYYSSAYVPNGAGLYNPTVYP